MAYVQHQSTAPSVYEIFLYVLFGGKVTATVRVLQIYEALPPTGDIRGGEGDRHPLRVCPAEGTLGEECGLSQEEAGQRYRDSPCRLHQSNAGQHHHDDEEIIPFPPTSFVIMQCGMHYSTLLSPSHFHHHTLSPSHTFTYTLL